MKIIVIGAGILGTSIARELVERGHEVVHVDDREPGGGTTSTTYAWINSHKKFPEAYHRLNMQGASYWRQRVAESVPEAFVASGHLEIADARSHRENLGDRVGRLDSLEYPAEFVSVRRARELSPLAVGEDALCAWFPDEGYAFPIEVVRAWTAELAALDSYSFVKQRVQAVTQDGMSARLEDGSLVYGDRTVIAAGNGSSALVASAGGILPLVDQTPGGAAFGFLAYADVEDHGVTSLVTTDRLNVRPLDEGRLLLQALDLDVDADPDRPAPDSVSEQFHKRLEQLLPTRTVTVDEVRVGHRVIPEDGLTTAGPLDDSGRGVWVAVTHSGVVLGPWLATVLADELLGGNLSPYLDDFRPGRFRKSSRAVAYEAPRGPGDQ